MNFEISGTIANAELFNIFTRLLMIHTEGVVFLAKSCKKKMILQLINLFSFSLTFLCQFFNIQQQIDVFDVQTLKLCLQFSHSLSIIKYRVLCTERNMFIDNLSKSFIFFVKLSLNGQLKFTLLGRPRNAGTSQLQHPQYVERTLKRIQRNFHLDLCR